jgi:hypothetical protein
MSLLFKLVASSNFLRLKQNDASDDSSVCHRLVLR